MGRFVISRDIPGEEYTCSKHLVTIFEIPLGHESL
jgi:hypothetical protein